MRRRKQFGDALQGMDETTERRIEKATIPSATHAFNHNRSESKYNGEITHPRHKKSHSFHMMLTESLILLMATLAHIAKDSYPKSSAISQIHKLLV